MSRPQSAVRGFTLVELLVVISIIGVLMSLLLPAVNAARESGRKTQCLNNLRQLGIAAQTHLEKNRRFPSGGWGPLWVGWADGGSNKKQPGGWFYNLLPFLDSTSLHDLGQNAGNLSAAQITENIAHLVSTTQSIMACPTRRSAQPWTAIAAMNPIDPTTDTAVDLQTQAFGNNVARGDYAANAGVRYDKATANATTDTEQEFGCFLDPVADLNKRFPKAYGTPGGTTGGVNGVGFDPLVRWTGVIYQRSVINDGAVKDGLSKTYLLGEKFVDSKHTEDGGTAGDQGNLYSGMGADNYRTTYVLPQTTAVSNGVDPTDPGSPVQTGTTAAPLATILTDQADPTASYGCIFGSAHSGGIVNFVFCDCSTKSISTGIDGLTHRYLGERNDGKILDDSMIGQ